jgi:broad specificity phosphatase PhoE
MRCSLVVVALLLAPGVALADSTVYVVRHAEKAKNEEDPRLTRRGRSRAETLARALRSVPLAAVYTTKYRRNRATAAPAAKQAGLSAIVVDAMDTDGLAKTIRERHDGKHVLVVGHSNTVPMILKSLGVKTPLEIDESDYDNLFVVQVAAKGGAKMSHLHFGALNHSDSGKRKTR